MPTLQTGSLTTIVLLLCCSFHLPGKERRLIFELDADHYELIFDDQLISYADMEGAAWLSPLIDNEGSPFMMGVTISPGRIEKTVMALPLVTCMPGYKQCMHPALNADFLRNAAKALEKSRVQLRLLKDEPLPVVLEPLRGYFVFTLQSNLDWVGAEYVYLRDSDIGPARRQFCRYCSCVANRDIIRHMAEERDPNMKASPEWKLLPRLLPKMAAEKDPAKKIELATHDYENMLVTCFHAHDPGYPMQVWKNFLREYKIQEIVRHKRID